MFSEANQNGGILKIKADKAIKLVPETRVEGEESARALADRLWNVYQKDPRSFGRILILYSPFDRTQETAIPYIYYLGKKFGRDSDRIIYRPDDRLIELQTGLRAGLKHSEFAAQYPDAEAYYQKQKKHNATAFAPSPFGETYIDAARRTRQTHVPILNDYDRKGVRHCLIVAHGGTIRGFVQGWMNYAPQWIMAENNPENNWVRHLRGIPRNGLVVDPDDFADLGYIIGKGAPINNPALTQQVLEGVEDSFVLQSQHPTAVPPGTKIINPYAAPRREF
jgi:broad specificity phosphatase PhoE